MKLLNNVKNIYTDMQEYFKYKINSKKKDKYQIVSDETFEIKNQKIFKNLKRDLIILLIVAIVGALFALININSNKIMHMNASKIESITIINYISQENAEAKSMTAYKEADIDKIVTNFNSLRKVSSISKVNEITENIYGENKDETIETNDEIIFVIDYKKENKEDTVVLLSGRKLKIDEKEYNINSKANNKALSNIGNIWYLLNYNVETVSEDEIKKYYK